MQNFKLTDDLPNIKDLKLEDIIDDINRISYDAENAINNAYDSLKYLEHDTSQKITDTVLFNKNLIFRNKIEYINN